MGKALYHQDRVRVSLGTLDKAVKHPTDMIYLLGAGQGQASWAKQAKGCRRALGKEPQGGRSLETPESSTGTL